MGNQQRSAITSILAIDEIRNGIIGDVYKGEVIIQIIEDQLAYKIVQVPKFLDWDPMTSTKGSI